MDVKQLPRIVAAAINEVTGGNQLEYRVDNVLAVLGLDNAELVAKMLEAACRRLGRPVPTPEDEVERQVEPLTPCSTVGDVRQYLIWTESVRTPAS